MIVNSSKKSGRIIITSTKMEFLIFSCAIYSTVISVLASETKAETLLPNIETKTLSTNIEGKVSTSVEDLSLDMENNIQTTMNPFSNVHESLKSCVAFALDPGEYELFPNGTAYVEAYNLTFDETHYTLINETLRICLFPFTPQLETQTHLYTTVYLTVIGIGISMIALLIHLIAFAVVPDLRNLPGCNLAALCASLFCSYLLFFVTAFNDIEKYRSFCVGTAFLIHFFLLASMLWMSIMSYDIFTSLLRATRSLRVSSTNFTFKRFGLYCLCAFGIALLFATASLLADNLDGLPENFKPGYEEICWFKNKTPLAIFFGGPVMALICLNFMFFGLSAYNLHHNKMKQNQDDQKSILKKRYFMYFRLSVIMGATWIVGIIASATKTDWLWYVFVLLNTLQGFFIFIAFTCCNKVKKYFREKYFGGKRGSEQTLSPTFQSNCLYANSIEKDTDKIVEKGKDKTDTIVIHM